jgi:ABC-2 type transport system permease protein
MHESGFATPLVVLGFCASWAFPLLASLIGGSIFSGEDHLGTWKTVLTRSRSRRQVFTGKLVASALGTCVLVVVLAVSSLLAGLVVVGSQPVIGLSGQLIGGGTATGLILLSWLMMLVPCLAFMALSAVLSIATRQTLIGIGGPLLIGAVMQMVSYISAIGPIRELLLTTPFLAWRGLFVEHHYYDELWRGAVVSLVYAVVLGGVAWWLMRTKEVSAA